MYLITGISETEYVLAFSASPSQPQGPRVTQTLSVSRKYVADGSTAVHDSAIYEHGLCGCISLCTHALSPFKKWAPLLLALSTSSLSEACLHEPSSLHTLWINFQLGFVVRGGSFSPLLNYNRWNSKYGCRNRYKHDSWLINFIQLGWWEVLV